MFLDRVVHFVENLGEQVKGSSNEKAKIVDRGSLCNAPESKGSKFEYEPNLLSVACSQTKLSVSGKFGDQVKGRFSKKLKSLIVDPYVAHMKTQVLSCSMNLISSP